MSGVRIAILDYGMGNLRSVEKAFERVGVAVERTTDAERAERAEGLVLPGVGAFGEAMRRLRALGFDELVRGRAARGGPVLGICLGYQLLFESSEEGSATEGLGLLEGAVGRLDAPGLKIPHMGWERVDWSQASPLVDGIPTATPFYFVHSLTPRPAEERIVLGRSRHGESFACAVASGPLHGVQFHPEKSSAAGLRLLGNFAGICARAGAAA